MNNLTQDYVKSLFEYKDGVFVHKTSKGKGKLKVGDKVGNLTSRGYLRVMSDYKEHALHKIIYLWNYGVYPEIIDHTDGNPLNNHIDNLRSVIHCQNMQNRKLPKNNTSGCKNVSFNKKYNKWQINIGFNKKRKIWFADDLELADLIAHEARNLYHKEYARHV